MGRFVKPDPRSIMGVRITKGSGWRKQTRVDKTLAKFDSIRKIDRKNVGRCPASRRDTKQDWTLPTKMAAPLLPPRVEQGNDPPRGNIESGYIGTFVIVTGKTG